MQDTAKYLIHADITANGVVERSDVVGAIFGQTEGLLGDDLDLRDLQDSSKVGRIDVEIDSERGQSFGEITIATSLDKVETAVLAAALETIERVGPCRSTVDVSAIEDVRAAKRREVVERATTLFHEAFDDSMLSSQELVEEVRQAVRVEDITEYRGYPAGPRVADSDAVIVVEGRADVLQLLQYGIKNAVAVEGTNIPEPIAALTRERTVTAFLDGDHGGELVLKELAQVGDVDYVAFAPPGRSVEDLDRGAVLAALREKTPYEQVHEGDGEDATFRDRADLAPNSTDIKPEPGGTQIDEDDDTGATESSPETDEEPAEEHESTADGDDVTASEESEVETPPADETPETLGGHVKAVIDEETGRVRLLDEAFGVLAEGDTDEAFTLVRDTETVPSVIVLDGELSQRVLDVAAQRGVDQILAAATGEFVKRPAGVRVRTADELRQPAEQ
ncbi:DNA primase DnaG [Halosegnis sp.]|uniref:DNA primase DnaG n=1 Tax=Halosegnis sp. TaxID=2864959 RepID=UPI0035D4B003